MMDFSSEPKQIYDSLFDQSIDEIRSGNIQTDQNLKNPANDNRRGISLIIKPDQRLISKIESLQNQLKSVEPFQYYQPKSDLHITLLSLISGYDGFDLKEIDIDEYIKLVQVTINQISNIKLHFQGITATREAVMVQGFPRDGTINSIRQELRRAFMVSGLKSSIDKRYTLKTAHITAVRFMNPLQNPQIFADALEKLREIELGEFEADKLFLVFNDWYQKQEKVEILKEFEL